MYKEIVVPMDGSEPSKRALSHAIELAKTFGARLTVITVLDEGHRLEDIEDLEDLTTGSPMSRSEMYAIMAQDKEGVHIQVLKKAEDMCRKAGAKVRTELLRGHVVEEIISFLDENPHDLVVMGSRGLGRFKKLLLGSTSSAVIQHCDHSVLIVK